MQFGHSKPHECSSKWLPKVIELCCLRLAWTLVLEALQGKRGSIQKSWVRVLLKKIAQCRKADLFLYKPVGICFKLMDTCITLLYFARKYSVFITKRPTNTGIQMCPLPTQWKILQRAVKQLEMFRFVNHHPLRVVSCFLPCCGKMPIAYERFWVQSLAFPLIGSWMNLLGKIRLRAWRATASQSRWIKSTSCVQMS